MLFRIISLKIKLKQAITPEEHDVLLQLEQQSFAIPEPILLQIKALGSTQTMTREHLYPEFPSLPTQLSGAFGEYYGPLSDDTHNLYEELPCLGVLSEAIRNQAPGPYASSLTTQELTANQNLLGHLGARRSKAKNLAFDKFSFRKTEKLTFKS